MAKNKGARTLVAWVAGAAFAAFSGIVALGLLHRADLWMLRILEEYTSGFLDKVAEIFSLFGTGEVLGTLLLVLFVMLYLRGRRALAGRLLAIFVVTGILELAMKLLLPQVRPPNPRIEEFSVLSAIATPYAYPSGHMLRGVICLGALCFLSRSRLLQVGVVLVLLGLAGSRIYLEAHWPSDVVGGALLGASALLWAFGREDQPSGRLWLLPRRASLLRPLSPKSINGWRRR